MLVSCPLLLARAPPLVAAVAAATTWSLTDNNSAGLAFTNSNRTATYTGGNTRILGRTAKGTTAGQKAYFEISISTIIFSHVYGMVAAATTLSGPTPGAAHVSTGFYVLQNTGCLSCSDSADDALAVISTLAAGDRVDFAFDDTNHLGWARRTRSGTTLGWNDQLAGTQNPATAQGGLPLPSFGVSMLPIYSWDGQTGDQITGNFATGDWLGTAPSGFTQIAA